MGVPGREKFGLTDSEIARFKRIVERTARKVEPKAGVDAVKADPTDNRVIECALECEADIIVSGDKRLLQLKSAKGADARRQTGDELARPSGGARDAGPVLREFLQSAKGADARRQTSEEFTGPSGGALRTGPVLREFLQSYAGILIVRVLLGLLAVGSTAAFEQHVDAILSGVLVQQFGCCG